MTESVVSSGHGITFWGMTHKDPEGNLICRQAIVLPPDPITCVKVSCLWKFMFKNLKYVMTLLYHQYRAEYAEKARGKEINMDYRTGENAPVTFWGLFWAIMRIPHE